MAKKGKPTPKNKKGKPKPKKAAPRKRQAAPPKKAARRGRPKVARKARPARKRQPAAIKVLVREPEPIVRAAGRSLEAATEPVLAEEPPEKVPSVDEEPSS